MICQESQGSHLFWNFWRARWSSFLFRPTFWVIQLGLVWSTEANWDEPRCWCTDSNLSEQTWIRIQLFVQVFSPHFACFWSSFVRPYSLINRAPSRFCWSFWQVWRQDHQILARVQPDSDQSWSTLQVPTSRFERSTSSDLTCRFQMSQSHSELAATS